MKLYWVVCCAHAVNEGAYRVSNTDPQTEDEARGRYDEPVAGFMYFDSALAFATELEATVRA